ncbi:hypothetical protein DFQ00_105219 [Paenibacillus barcinonensis]|uniref:Uncharacterized protein n=1 Tax=Paenibacillus barcinonensis TaxID=198119 RepID=A0A2V4V9X6_PAEBA|nr:hypothetical protein DFQ00_105219 [Paenibacillus barcinonensis]
MKQSLSSQVLPAPSGNNPRIVLFRLIYDLQLLTVAGNDIFVPLK